MTDSAKNPQSCGKGARIEVEVKLYATLAEGRFQKSRIGLDASATVADLLEHLAMKRDEVEAIYINGSEAVFAKALEPGDRISLLPFIGGG